MPVDFLHGVETIEVPIGTKKINIVKSAVVALVGIAPVGRREQLVLVSGEKDGAEFGPEVPGFSIPEALASIFAQGAGTVLVVNVFDPAEHLVAVTNEDLGVDANGRARFAFPPVSDIVVKDSTAAITYVKDTHYTVSAFGDLRVLDFTQIEPLDALKVSYKKLDPAITADTMAPFLIGDFVDGVRTGSKLFDLSRQMYGFNPKIFIAPRYSHDTSVSLPLIALADKFRAMCYLDAPIGTLVDEAIIGRGPLGEINFNTSSQRAELLCPMVKGFSKYLAADAIRMYSAYMAGLRAFVDANEGFHVSTSNHVIKGISAMEYPISGEINKADTEANLLNAAGITTLFNEGGIRSWGNRNSSFPVYTDMYTFSKFRRTADILHESIEYFMIAYMDDDITPVLTDLVRQDVNAFMRVLITRGALVEGSKCLFLAEDNPPEELAAGHATWVLDFNGYAPLERATFKSSVNTQLLSVG